MNRFLSICILLGTLLAGTTQAQFQYAIGTSNYEAGRSVKFAASDPGYIVAGRTDLAVFGPPEATLVKTKMDGTLVWQAVYGGAKTEIFNTVRDINQTSNNTPGYAALGSSQSFGLGGDDVYFVRTDLTGVPLFTYLYGREKDDRGNCLQYIQDPTIGTGNGYIIAGETASYPSFPGLNVYIVKTDEFGGLIRATVIGGEGDDVAYSIIQTRDLGFVAVGSTTSKTCGGGTPNKDIFIIKLDVNLNIQWNAIIGGGPSRPFPDIAYSVVENIADGTFTVTGITQSYGVNFNGDSFLLNLSPAGAVNWFKTYGIERTEQGNNVYLTVDIATGALQYVVGGLSTSYTTGTEDAYLFKTDVNGNLIWTNIYAAQGRDVIAEIGKSEDRGYIFTGEVENNWTQKNDIYLVKTDVNGKTGTGCEMEVRQNEIRWDICYNKSAQQIFVQDNKRIETPYKFVTYKEIPCNPLAVGSKAPEPNGLELALDEQNKLKVTFDKEVQNTTVKVFNTNGNLITQTNISGRAGEVNLSAAPAGLYIIHITYSDGTIVRKKIMK